MLRFLFVFNRLRIELIDKLLAKQKRRKRMNELMKVMIAYDGSGYADVAIDDLDVPDFPKKEARH